MSTERVVQAAEAVEDLRKALELWCTRDLAGPNSLHVHRSGTDAITAADAAIRALTSIREQTQFEISRYLTAQNNRVTELLAPPVAVEVAPPYPEPSTSYECGECGETFPVDPTDPIESHGAYLDHQAEHDDDDAERWTCAAPNPTDTTGCAREEGHDGDHKDANGETWGMDGAEQ